MHMSERSWKEAIEMLVVSRNENDRIVFPQLGISVEVIQVSRTKVKLGVEAPRSIRVLRHEIADKEPASLLSPETTDTASKLITHDHRNKLNGAMLKLQLAAKLLESGEVSKGLERLTAGIADLNILESGSQIAKTEGEGQLAKEFEPIPQKNVQTTDRDVNVLIVDDDDNERVLLASYLRECGLDVDQASNGMEALYSLSNKTRPDVVLLDMNMPEMDGRATVSRIRNSSQHREVPVFAVTGESFEECGIEIGKNGVTQWFQKPIEAEEIVSAIKECFASRRK